MEEPSLGCNCGLRRAPPLRHVLPEQWIVEVLIPTTNKDLDMACFNGIEDRELWWLTKPLDMFSGAPFWFNGFMTYSRFRKIMSAIRYTDKPTMPLLFNDPFHEVRQMIDAFNDYYADQYTPSWLNCIDESMSSYRNPHPQGNEYHSIADADKDGTKPIMWRVKLVEGKDCPKADGQYVYASQFEKKGPTPTVALLLEMTEPIHGTGKVVTGDSGFCVTQGVLALHEVGIMVNS